MTANSNQTNINIQILEGLASEAENIQAWGFPAGMMSRRIREYDTYEEGGLVFNGADAAVGQLYAGLSALSRDMAFYLAQNPRQDAGLFEEVVTLVHEDERSRYGNQAFPYYTGLPTDDLPAHLAAAAAQGRPTITPLGDPKIVHEWTFKPGKRLFRKFAAKFKDTICGKNGPYEQFNNGLVGQAALPVTIASNILASGFSQRPSGIPLPFTSAFY